MLMPGWEWVGATAGGTSYLNDVPDKIVLHTTEGNSADAAIGAYRSHGGWPHFTLDYWRNRAIQHIDTDVAASALWNERGNNYEPNRSGRGWAMRSAWRLLSAGLPPPSTVQGTTSSITTPTFSPATAT